MVLRRQTLLSLATAEAYSDAGSYCVDAILAQGCSRALETCHLLLLLAVYANICTDVVCAVGYDLALFCADSICKRLVCSTK